MPNNLKTPSGYYDSIAEAYDNLFYDELSKAENKIVERDLEQLILKNKKQKYIVLDLGCGTGLGLEMLLNIKRQYNIEIEYYGMDVSEEMIEIAKSKNLYFNAHFFHADMNDLPLAVRSMKFDLVISLFGSFSYATNPKKLINTLLKMTNSEIDIYLMTYSRFSLKNIYACIKNFDIKKLSPVQNYNIRNSNPLSGCDAYFYTPKKIKGLRVNRKNNKIGFKTINGLFEIPIFKRMIRKLNGSLVFAILLLERRILHLIPILGHSLIIIINHRHE